MSLEAGHGGAHTQRRGIAKWIATNHQSSPTKRRPGSQNHEEKRMEIDAIIPGMRTRT